MHDRKFEVHCNAGDNGQLNVQTNSLSIRAGQLIRRNGTEEMCDSILVLCQVGDDGVLTTKVIISHPDWDHPLQIANIQSCLPDSGKLLEIDTIPVKV